MDVVHCFSSAYINRKINKIQTNRMLLIPIHLLTRWPSGDNPMCKYISVAVKKKRIKRPRKERKRTPPVSKENFFIFNAPVVKRLYRKKKEKVRPTVKKKELGGKKK